MINRPLPHQNIDILPSLLYKQPAEMEDKAREYQQQVNLLHIDFADGLFVPNTLPDVDQVRRLAIRCQIEAHFMVNQPDSWISQSLTDDRFQTIVFHIEAQTDPAHLIDSVKRANRCVGLALNPGTSIETLNPYLDQLDQVTVMTVDPGFNGSPFRPDALAKVDLLRHQYPNLTIECDGGINPQTAAQAVKAGANRLVVGSFFHQNSLTTGLRAIRANIDSQAATE